MIDTPRESHLRITPRRAAAVSAVVGLTVGAIVLWRLPQSTGVATHAAAFDPSGPGFFPLLAGFLTVAAGLWCLLGVRRSSQQAATDALHSIDTLPLRSTVRIAAWMAAAIALTPAIGMLAAIGLMTAGLAHAFGERRWPMILLLGAGTAIGIYLVFESTLRILFPRGPFG